MAFRIMIPFILSMLVVSCSSQPTSKVDLKTLDLNHYVVAEKTALMVAAEKGQSTQVRNALEQGAKLNSVSPEGTAFSLALMNGHESISKILFSAGSNWHYGFEKEGSSALIYAALKSYDNLVKTLILRGAVVNHTDNQGYSALARAAQRGNLTTMKILIKAGADVNITPKGQSLLMHTVEDNNMLLSQILIKAGADVNFKDVKGETALKIARRKGYFDLDLMLVQSGALP